MDVLQRVGHILSDVIGLEVTELGDLGKRLDYLLQVILGFLGVICLVDLEHVVHCFLSDLKVDTDYIIWLCLESCCILIGLESDKGEVLPLLGRVIILVLRHLLNNLTPVLLLISLDSDDGLRGDILTNTVIDLGLD